HRLSLPQETRQYVHRFYALTQLIDVTALNNSSFQPLMLFSSQPAITRQALINLQPLPPLVKL
ncbi:lytic murein transglycosylase, partial [Vibrio fluvialis]|nr:lytic murein transglycosylase [Vibrio fluvialis]